MNFKPITNALSWAWQHREEIMGVVASGTSFAGVAGLIVSHLISKTPDGNPASVTDEMVQALKDNWRGVLPSSESLGFPADAEPPQGS